MGFESRMDVYLKGKEGMGKGKGFARCCIRLLSLSSCGGNRCQSCRVEGVIRVGAEHGGGRFCPIRKEAWKGNEHYRNVGLSQRDGVEECF